jgi:hypothetical protein
MVKILNMMKQRKMHRLNSQNVDLMRKSGIQINKGKDMIYFNHLEICKKGTKLILIWQINYFEDPNKRTFKNTHPTPIPVTDPRISISLWKKK